ncbi:MAG: hypothetical protein EXX96DRAFT_482900 [Benjaminiella poitrasii]|nr:MAG: hypothetical protein EXX96DRAFT_482900 [Benjaminiella poitrasii]
MTINEPITPSASTNFADNFWESIDKNGITILIERMKGAKQTCERFRHAYEARALLEEEYGKTLLQITQKQKPSTIENGSSKAAMDTMQTEFLSVAESHLHLSNLLRENIALPLSNLLNKQKALRKQAHKRHNLEIEKANLLVKQQTTEEEKRAVFETAQVTIDKLKNVYDEAVKDLDRIVEEWNIEWRSTCDGFEKLEQERLDFFKSNISNCANLMVGCLEDEVQACERINEQAVKIDVTQDLKEFVTLNKSSQKIPTNQDAESSKNTRDEIDNDEQSESEDRVQVRIRRKRSSTMSSVVSEDSISASKNNILKSAAEAAAAAEAALLEKQKEKSVTGGSSNEPILTKGIMEVYPSDEEEDDEYEYITETESEGDYGEDTNDNRNEVSEDGVEQALKPEPVLAIETNEIKLKSNEMSEQHDQPKVSPREKDANNQQEQNIRQEEDVTIDGLLSDYEKETKKDQQSVSSSLQDRRDSHAQRRVSYADDTNSPINLQSEPSNSALHRSVSRSAKIVDPTSTLKEEPVDYEASNDAAVFELDDMLRELDSKRIEGEESMRQRQTSQHVRPAASVSSPSYIQKQQHRRSYTPSQYLNKQYPTSRRMSTVENAKPRYIYNNQAASIRSSTGSYMDLYDPFNSLSSKETGSTLTSKNNSIESTTAIHQSSIPPTAQMIHDRMLSHNEKSRRRQSYHGSVSSSTSSSLGSLRSIDQQPQSYSNDKFVQDFYSISSKTTSPNNTLNNNDGHFIDFAVALYDYEASDEGEIGFKEGDLLGIISKSDNDEQGWWEASVLNRRNQKIIRTGLVPSNFLETASK